MFRKKISILKKTFGISVALFIFAMGVFIGKKYGDAQNQTQLARLDKYVNRATPGAENCPGQTVVEKEMAKDNDNDPNAKLDPYQVEYDSLVEKSNPSKDAKNELAKKDLTENDQLDKTAVHSSDDEENSEKPAPTVEKRVVASVTDTEDTVKKSPAVGKYTIQLFSGRIESNAKKFVKGLIDKGINAYYVKIHPNEKANPIFVAYAGVFDDRAEALKFREKLSKELPGSTTFVTKIKRL